MFRTNRRSEHEDQEASKPFFTPSLTPPPPTISTTLSADAPCFCFWAAGRRCRGSPPEPLGDPLAWAVSGGECKCGEEAGGLTFVMGKVA